MSERKLRLGNFVVQPILVWDDGESLLPALNDKGGPLVAQLVVNVDGLREIADTWSEQLAKIEGQLQPAPVPPEG